MESSESQPSRWYKLAPAAGLVAITFGIYCITLAPTVTSEDSGELIAAAHFFGIPHPPGYPLWTILCGMFMRVVPVGEAAYRANLFSAVCGSLATWPLFAALVAMGLRRSPAFAGALTFALSRTLWSQCVITEVYGLHALLCATLLWVMVRWYAGGKDRWLIAGSVLVGAGMCNHHTIGFFALAFVVWVVALQPPLLKKWRMGLGCVFAFLVALLPYCYLPLRASTSPPLNWGNPADAGAFWRHVSRHQYGSVAPMPITRERSFARFAEQMSYGAGVVIDDLTVPVAMISIIGLPLMLRRRKAYAFIVLLVVLTSGALFLLISNFDLDRTMRHAMRVFLIPIAMMLSIPLAFALNAALSARSAASRVSRRVLACAVCLVPLIPALTHYARCNYSDYWFAEDHARNLLAGMLPGAIVFPSADHNTFPLVYITLVRGVRPDVTVADKYGYVDPAVVQSFVGQDAGNGLSDNELQSLLIKKARRPAYFTTKKAPPVSTASFVPVGLTYLLLPDGMTADREAPWDAIAYRNSGVQPSAEDLGADHILGDYYFFRALESLRRHERARALQEFGRCAELLHGVKEMYNNIGSALAEHGMLQEAIPYFESASDLDDLYLSARRNLALVHSRLENWRETERLLLEAIDIAPDDPRAFAELGFLVLRVDQDRERAEGYFKDSLARDPDQPNVIKALNGLLNPDS